MPFIASQRYHSKNNFGTRNPVKNIGRRTPPKPTKTTHIRFIESNLQTTLGTGKRLNSYISAPEIHAAIEWPSSCVNGYTMIAATRPTTISDIPLKISFIASPFLVFPIGIKISRNYVRLSIFPSLRYAVNSALRSSVRLSQ